MAAPGLRRAHALEPARRNSGGLSPGGVRQARACASPTPGGDVPRESGDEAGGVRSAGRADPVRLEHGHMPGALGRPVGGARPHNPSALSPSIGPSRAIVGLRANASA